MRATVTTDRDFYPSEIHSVPGLSSFDPRDRELVRQFVLELERQGYLIAAGQGHGRTPAGLKFNPVTAGPELERLRAEVGRRAKEAKAQ
jgi:hypothetical protein